MSYVNGKKVLDTKNANYSYGSLQKILEFGLTKVDLKSVDNLLVLGMGGGSIVKSLRETFEYEKNIVAVEIDPKIIQIAEEEFGIVESESLQIIQEDAFQYVKDFDLSAGAEEKFQLIIIDLFIDLNVPPIFYGKEFCENTANLLQEEGYVIFNIGVNLRKESKAAQNIIVNFGEGFEFQRHEKVNGTNFLLIGTKDKNKHPTV